jgi:hypothetical protein
MRTPRATVSRRRWDGSSGERRSITFWGFEAARPLRAEKLWRWQSEEAARQWLDWEREEIGVLASGDPLTAEGFLKLWPLRPAIPENDQVLAAAGALAARGKYFHDAADVLMRVRECSQDSGFRNDIDIALVQGLSRGGEYSEAAPVWLPAAAVSQVGDRVQCARRRARSVGPAG